MGVRVIFPYLWLITCEPHLLMLIRKVLSYPANKTSPHSYCEKNSFFFFKKITCLGPFNISIIWSQKYIIFCVSALCILCLMYLRVYIDKISDDVKKKNLIYVNDLKIWKIHVQSELIKVNRYMKHPTIRW